MIYTKISKPDININLIGDSSKFYSDLVYTDYKLENINSNSFTINTNIYKYADVFLELNNSTYIKVNGNNQQNNNYILKLKTNDKVELDGTLVKGYIIYHNGYWSDYNFNKN